MFNVWKFSTSVTQKKEWKGAECDKDIQMWITARSKQARQYGNLRITVTAEVTNIYTAVP
jgi:hypothetical protein